MAMSSSRTTCASRSGRARMSVRSTIVRQQFLVLGDDLVLLEAREAVQAHVENGLGLDLGELVAAARHRDAELRGETLRPRGDVTGARQHLRHGAGIPHARMSAGLRFHRRGRSLDERDDLVDVGQRHGEAFENVGAIARLGEIENRAARDDLAPVPHEGFEHLLERRAASAGRR